MSNEIKSRINWIDCTRFVAITAVVVNHNARLMYQSDWIEYFSLFSVTLFILVSGVSTYFSYEKNEYKIISFKTNLLKQRTLIKRIVIAGFINFLFVFLFSRQQETINYYYVLTLDGMGYFVVFFIQLKIITPLLLSIFKKCDKQCHPWVWHCITLFIILIVSLILMKYCRVFPFYGGGAYLFGGTYLFIYYVGIVLGSSRIFEIKNKNIIFVIFCVSLIACMSFVYLQISSNFYFNRVFSTVLGEGLNPPGLFISVYSVLVLMVCYAFFTIVESISVTFIKKIIICISILGRNSLYIYMYHLLIRKIIFGLFPGVANNLMMLRFIVFPLMIVGAPLFVFLRIKRRIQE